MDSQTLADIMITAIEGGSGYWCNNFLRVSGAYDDRLWYACPKFWAQDDYCVKLTTVDDEICFVTSISVNKAVQLLPGFPYDDFDADDADRFLQTVAFGEVVYG